MVRKVSRGVGSISGVEDAEKNAAPDSTITSAPEDHDVAERDSGVEGDPSTTGPVETDGNINEVELQSNETIASDNPTNAEVAEEKDLINGLGTDNQLDGNLLGDLGDNPDSTEVTDPVEPGDNLDNDIDGLANSDLDPVDEDVQLSDEEIAAAAAELASEQVATAPVTKHVIGNDGQIEDVSSELEADEDEGALAPSHNGSGHRNTFINPKGDITVMDDETAERFYADPKFYEYTYDSATGKNTHVSFLRWANGSGAAVGGRVGDSYELDK